MACPLSPQLPFSFDPAVHLHSELDVDPILPLSETNAEELEALQTQQQELAALHKREGVVIQHKGWLLANTLNSDDIHNPGVFATYISDPLE